MLSLSTTNRVTFNVNIFGTAATPAVRCVLGESPAYSFPATKLGDGQYEVLIDLPSTMSLGAYPFKVEVLLNGRLFTPINHSVPVTGPIPEVKSVTMPEATSETVLEKATTKLRPALAKSEFVDDLKSLMKNVTAAKQRPAASGLKGLEKLSAAVTAEVIKVKPRQQPLPEVEVPAAPAAQPITSVETAPEMIVPAIVEHAAVKPIVSNMMADVAKQAESIELKPKTRTKPAPVTAKKPLPRTVAQPVPKEIIRAKSTADVLEDLKSKAPKHEFKQIQFPKIKAVPPVAAPAHTPAPAPSISMMADVAKQAESIEPVMRSVPEVCDHNMPVSLIKGAIIYR